jgi:Family of unknown function (DUF6807)
MRWIWTIGLSLVLWLLANATVMAQTPLLRIEGTGRDLNALYFSLPMPMELQGEGPFGLAISETEPFGIAQVVGEGPARTLWIGIDRLANHANMQLKMIDLFESKTDLNERGVGFENRDGGLRVLTQKSLFAEYRNDDPRKPYFWPLIGPTGDPFTRSFPMADVRGEDRDHNHQRSMWFTHGDVNGFDFWASDELNPPNPKHGRIRETSREVMAAGLVVGILRTTNEWLSPDGTVICEDERILRCFQSGPFDPHKNKPRTLDFEVTVKATHGPVTFGDTKEGSFGIRVASSMDVNKKMGGKITNAEGITDGDAWGKPSPWVDYTGPIGEETVGIAILNHPDSFRYPTTWHVRDYGLFAANPFGYHEFKIDKPGAHTIPAGESMTLKYRVLLHEGTTKEADIAGSFEAYSNPPKVTFEVR